MKKKKKSDKVVLITLCCFIVFFTVVLIVLHCTYFNVKTYMVNYLSIKVKDYVVDLENDKLINSEDDKCHILLSSNYNYNGNIVELNNVELINEHEWGKQNFELGTTWFSYYNNSFYIVQMYADDEKTYNEICKKDFDEVKDTFSFIKNE